MTHRLCVGHGLPCRHCGRVLSKSGRGLCRRCHLTPGVLALYPLPPRRVPSAACRHCSAPCGGTISRRGLCYGCHATPDVLALYPSRQRPAGPCPPQFATGPAEAPCPHPPGSEGKVAAMEARALAGQWLFHPGDAAGDVG